MSAEGNQPPKGLGAVAGRMRSMFQRRRGAEAKASASAVAADPADEAQIDTVIGTTEDPSQAPLMEHLRELRQRVFIYIIVFFVLTVGA
ncbi:MAG: hypothetical protein VX152_08605, partial [Pseudomonadota bacterium]|nr:hypothetical protein [Pseudomonadota bacterium]